MKDEPIDQEAGEPVAVLREFSEDPPQRFLNIVRRKIHRRTATAQAADFSWKAPGMILLELTQLLRHLLFAFGDGKGPAK
jgi:hypothetical protein